MSHQMMDYDDELMKVWALVTELSEQLANNRALVTQLKARAENAKGQAVHLGAGFPLRRFNLDISDEEFQTELEAFASHLVLENQSLQHENKQLNIMLKEYEQTLETVMGKFRGVSHASQQHDLALHSYYSQLLQSLQAAHSAAQLHDDTTLSTLTARLSTLLRSAMRSLGGEETDGDALAQLHISDLLPLQLQQVQSLGAASGGGSPTSDSAIAPASGSGGVSPLSPSSPTRPGTSTSPRIAPPRAPPRRSQPFPGFIPGSSGGYYGTEGQADWAMEREMEIQRLEDENRALREMLGIAEEAPVMDAGADSDDALHPPSPIPGTQHRHSLTVEELEAGAEQEEAAAKERAEHPEAIAEGAGDGAASGAYDDNEDEVDKLESSIIETFRVVHRDDVPPENVIDETDGTPA